MWNEILGALTILGMIMIGLILIPAAPKLVDAICDRIRYGRQTSATSDANNSDHQPGTGDPADTTAPSVTSAEAEKDGTPASTKKLENKRARVAA